MDSGSKRPGQQACVPCPPKTFGGDYGMSYLWNGGSDLPDSCCQNPLNTGCAPEKLIPSDDVRCASAPSPAPSPTPGPTPGPGPSPSPWPAGRPHVNVFAELCISAEENVCAFMSDVCQSDAVKNVVKGSDACDKIRAACSSEQPKGLDIEARLCLQAEASACSLIGHLCASPAGQQKSMAPLCAKADSFCKINR
jgi:hypothetical protein